jgi:hypothetical protein
MRLRTASRRVAERREEGAAAVEFALVVPLLMLLVFGIIDYGIWFNDSVAMRQGVREAARQGVVANFGSADCDLSGVTGGNDNSRALVCTVKDRTGALSGEPQVMVKAPQGWVRGAPLVVCSQMKVSTATGVVPLPNDKIIETRVEMAIEQVPPGTTFVQAAESPAPGGSWSWC